MSTVLTMVYYKNDKTYAIRMKTGTEVEVESRRTFKTMDGAKRFMQRLEADILRITRSEHQWQDVPVRKN